LPEYRLLKVLIPFQQYNFAFCVELILLLKGEGLIYEYEVRKEGLTEVFNYLVHQTSTSLNLMQTASPDGLIE
jgi:hypothetical protein